jgi:hypothetical protein
MMPRRGSRWRTALCAPTGVERLRFTVAEFARMVEASVFRDDERLCEASDALIYGTTSRIMLRRPDRA